MQPSGPQFSGTGWDKLTAAIQKSQFVLVGEDHGIAQIPPFVAAVAREFRPAVYVVEIDPYIAQKLQQLVKQPGPATTYLRQYPEALCFYDWTEEFELLRTLRAQQVRLVGLDQVYLTTTAPFYAQLAELVKSQPARAYLLRRAAAYAAQNQAFEKLGNDDWAMDKQTQAAVDSLALVTRNESLAAQQMARAYATSYTIYKTQAHQLRVDLMKRNLLQALQPYQTPTGLAAPKMLFKFGSTHLARGLSNLRRGDYYDVGNLVQNLADVQEQKSLHLYVIGKQGEQAESDNPNLPAKRVRTYTSSENELLKPFLAVVTSPAWSVFDLRPARQAITAGRLQVPENLRRTVLGYDYLIVIPETTASHAM